MTRRATREVRVAHGHPALPGHFSGAPIVPAAWQLTLVEQTCREVLGDDIVVAGIASVRFRAPWPPGVGVTITISQTASQRVQFVVDAWNGRVADGVLLVVPREGPQ